MFTRVKKLVVVAFSLAVMLASSVGWGAPTVKEHTLPAFESFTMRPRISGDWVVASLNETDKACLSPTKGVVCYNLRTKETYTIYNGQAGWCDVRGNIATWNGMSGTVADFMKKNTQASAAGDPSNLIVVDLGTWNYYNPPLSTGPIFAPVVSGNHVAYQGKGNQIYFLDLRTGRQKKVSSGRNSTACPQICGDLVIWEERVNKCQIRGYSISRNEEFPITTVSGGQCISPKTDGITVVWYDAKNEIWAWDVATGKTTHVVHGFYPDIAGGIVVYMKGDCVVYGTDLRDGKEFRISAGDSKCGPSISMGRVIWQKDDIIHVAELSFK